MVEKFVDQSIQKLRDRTVQTHNAAVFCFCDLDFWSDDLDIWKFSSSFHKPCKIMD